MVKYLRCFKAEFFRNNSQRSLNASKPCKPDVAAKQFLAVSSFKSEGRHSEYK